MDVKAESKRGKYENYEDDTFYLELERQIVLLIDDVNSDDLKPRKSNASSSIARNEEIRLLYTRNYYDWSVCRNSFDPSPLPYFPAASVSGTGVFIPQHNNVKFEYRDCQK